MSVTRNPDQVRRVLGFMPDAFGVYDDMKVWEYLDFFARCYGIAPGRPATGDRATCSSWSTSPTSATTTSQTLSRGMQQRLCLAHALVHDPQVLLLDEPASGLDPRARVELRELLRELRVDGQDDPDQQPHPARARGAVHERRDRRSRPGARPGPRRRHRAAAPLRGRAAGARCCSRARRSRRPATGSPPTPTSRRRVLLDDGTIELGFRGDDEASARLLAESVAPGMPIVSFARAASDLEELFLQVTSPDREPVAAA